MDSNASIQLSRVLEGLEDQIMRLESSPNRPFVLIEYETLKLFHYFNLHFKKFWDEFDRKSASQLFQFYKYYNSHSELSKRYENLFREQIEYLGRTLNNKDKRVIGLSPVVFSEVKSKDLISYYDEYCRGVKDVDGKPYFEIILDRDYCSEEIDGKEVPVNIYKFHSEKINSLHYNGLSGILKSINHVFILYCAVCSYPNNLINGYDLDEEEIHRALENELCQYAKEIGKKVERDLRRIAQYKKSSRNAQLTPDVWGQVMDEEDDLYRLAISGQLENNEEKRFENIFEEQRIQLIDNASLLQKIMSTAIDGELFDIRLSIETHNLLSSLNSDNLDLFYELVLRRNIIQREMYPEELRAKYEEWISPPVGQSKKKETPGLNEDYQSNQENRLNYIAPKLALQDLLKGVWFDSVSVDKEKYSVVWRQTLVEELMKSDYGKNIATDWADESKRLQVKFAFIGALKDLGVFNCSSYNSLATKFTISGVDSASLAKYMGYGKRKSYYEWLKQQVKPEILE